MTSADIWRKAIAGQQIGGLLISVFIQSKVNAPLSPIPSIPYVFDVLQVGFVGCRRISWMVYPIPKPETI